MCVHNSVDVKQAFEEAIKSDFMFVNTSIYALVSQNTRCLSIHVTLQETCYNAVNNAVYFIVKILYQKIPTIINHTFVH